MLWIIVIVCLPLIGAEQSCPQKCFCNKDLTSVNCEGKHLTAFPAGIPVSVQKLYLGHNDFTDLTRDQFKEFKNLVYLEINNNKITNIETLAFSGLEHLTYLDLRINNIMELTDNSLAGMPKLETLYLTTNKIHSIDKNTFGNSTSLIYISLQANSLTTIPSLGNQPRLKRLVLEGNSISDATFPESYGHSTLLETIVLSNNQIKNLTDKTFVHLKGFKLATLYLSRNVLDSVDPGTLQYFTRISSLKLGSNPLSGSALKSALHGLQGKEMASLDISGIKIDNALMQDTFVLLKDSPITTLNMGYNKLRTLQNNAFNGLNKLQHLDISSCQIQETEPHAFAGLDKLTVLSMKKNQLADVPQNLPSTLTSLYLDWNLITSVKSNIFAHLNSLEELLIRYNHITSLEQDAFIGMGSLKKLSLYDNNIANLPGQLFSPLVRLVSLDLAKNSLQQIAYSAQRFSSQSSLLYFSLADNGCSYLQKDIFQGMTALKYLHLERNELGQLIKEDYSGSLFKGMGKLEELSLNGNRISQIPDPFFQDLSSLRVLNISFNSIVGWGPNLFKSTQSVKTLDLSNNLVATIKENNLHDLSSMKFMNLTNNPFACNCDLRWFRDWINKTSVNLTDKVFYTCTGPKNWEGVPLLSFNRSKINCLLFPLKIVIGCSVGVAAAIIICGLILYRKRWHIKLFCYKLTRGKSRRRPLLAGDGRGNYGAIEYGEETYDAYISCAEEDKLWVKEHLLPGIDNGQINEQLKFGGDHQLYFEDRDSDPGNSEVGNIFEHMQLSRKVLIILSRHYLDNPMNLFEWDTAVRQMYSRHIEEIIIIDIDSELPRKKIPKHMRATLMRHEAITWTEDDAAQQLFKQQLKDRLGRRTHLAADIGGE